MSELVSEILQSWFTPFVRWEERVEGNRPQEISLVLGCRAGPSVETSNLLHEMAHFIEIDDDRCTLIGWGLRVPKIYIMGQVCDNTQTFQACAREIRTMAIQKVLHREFGVKFDDLYYAKLVYDWVTGYFAICEEYPELPNFGSEMDYHEIQKIHYERIARDIRERAEKHTIESLRQEWNRKCSIVQERFGK